MREVQLLQFVLPDSTHDTQGQLSYRSMALGIFTCVARAAIASICSDSSPDLMV